MNLSCCRPNDDECGNSISSTAYTIVSNTGSDDGQNNTKPTNSYNSNSNTHSSNNISSNVGNNKTATVTPTATTTIHRQELQHMKVSTSLTLITSKLYQQQQLQQQHYENCYLLESNSWCDSKAVGNSDGDDANDDGRGTCLIKPKLKPTHKRISQQRYCERPRERPAFPLLLFLSSALLSLQWWWCHLCRYRLRLRLRLRFRLNIHHLLHYFTQRPLFSALRKNPTATWWKSSVNWQNFSTYFLLALTFLSYCPLTSVIAVIQQQQQQQKLENGHNNVYDMNDIKHVDYSEKTSKANANGGGSSNVRANAIRTIVNGTAIIETILPSPVIMATAKMAKNAKIKTYKAKSFPITDDDDDDGTTTISQTINISQMKRYNDDGGRSSSNSQNNDNDSDNNNTTNNHHNHNDDGNGDGNGDGVAVIQNIDGTSSNNEIHKFKKKIANALFNNNNKSNNNNNSKNNNNTSSIKPISNDDDDDDDDYQNGAFSQYNVIIKAKREQQEITTTATIGTTTHITGDTASDNANDSSNSNSNNGNNTNSHSHSNSNSSRSRSRSRSSSSSSNNNNNIIKCSGNLANIQQQQQLQQHEKHQQQIEQEEQEQGHNINKNPYKNDGHLHDELLDSFRGTHHTPRQPLYTNEFALHIPNGHTVADVIASKHNFMNMGQIGALKGFYLFHHKHISKRSLQTSDVHHKALKSEPEVHWLQQQHEKVRRKRDGPYQSLPGLRSFHLLQPANIFGTNLHSSHSNIFHPVVLRSPRLQFRDTGPHNIFPDPLFKEQWYLNGGAKDGLDMNVEPAWQKGYTGKGVVVSILDDGIQTNHPDLAQNYDPDASFDINGNDSDPTPQDNGDNKHGTRCAGEVAAVAFNNYCGVGVAYNASIGGVRMLDGKVNDVVEAQALSLNPSHIDIYSASWGPEDDGSTVDGPGPLARRAFIYGVTSGRQGKGSIFVWASGNGGRYTDSCNCDGYTNSIFTLSISSATQGGFKPWYLEECSSTLATTYSSGTPGHDKSVATVDMDGRLRPDHMCTVEHTGTSASAPLAAGICALALEANPNLTWRDMQYLVVYTSRPAPLEKENGWMLNGVKRKYSHKFGYGLMDAGAMVSLAEQWTTVPPQHICKSRENNEDRKIEATYGFTLATHMDVNGCAGTINEVRFLEHVQCRITLRFFPRGNLRILLTSPMGTTSTLLFERPRDLVKSNFDDWPFLSVHFWGEKAEGRWSLQIINGGQRRVNQPGILSKWQLIFYGTAVQPLRLKNDIVNQQLRGSANPYAFPTESDLGQSGGNNDFFNMDPINGVLSFQNLYTGAASNPEQAVATVDGHNIPTPQRQNVMADSNNKLVLHDCDPECDSQGCYGRGPTQCVACKHYRLDNTCVSRCPPRSFPNQGGVCWPCHESCETCAGAGQDSCLTCAPAHLHVTDLAVCLQLCPEGYYENYDNKTCVPCEANCASCQDRPDYCASCEHHLVMHDHKCFSSCPLHTYETEDYNCASCHSSCATCNGSAESQCITCRSGRFAHDGKCLNSCPDGFYADKKRQECIACPTGCATCSSNGFCLTCQKNWSRNKKGKCIITGSENCDESEYFDNNRCHPCHSTCETCNGPIESNCLSCPQSLLLQNNRCVSSCDDSYYMEAGVCAKCLHTCTQCVSRMNCTACAKGLQLQSGECRTTCADGYYSDRGTCAKCYLSCHTCSGPRRDQCVECPSDWQLAGGECHPECPEGFYKSEFGCQKCHHYCKTCHGAGPLACTSCPPHFMLDGGLCMECLGSQYYDSPTQTCKTCHESCRSCTGPGQYSCKTCAFPLHLDRLNNQCVPCCANDASPEDQSCCHCDKDTGGCINASPAGKRRIAAAAEQQQFGSSYGNNGGLYGNLLDDEPSATGFIGSLSDYLSRIDSPLTTITAIAVAACLLIVTVFALIFAVLQRSSNYRTHKTMRYNKVPTNGRRRQRITSSTSLLKIDAETNVEEEEDDIIDIDIDEINESKRQEDFYSIQLMKRGHSNKQNVHGNKHEQSELEQEVDGEEEEEETKKVGGNNDDNDDEIEYNNQNKMWQQNEKSLTEEELKVLQPPIKDKTPSNVKVTCSQTNNT